MKSAAQTIRNDAKALMERLKAEGRFADATTLRRLIYSHMGQANTLADHHRQLRAVNTNVRQALHAASDLHAARDLDAHA